MSSNEVTHRDILRQWQQEKETSSAIGAGPELEELRSYRFRNGLDLWSGEPLTGKARAEWLAAYQEFLKNSS